MKEIAFSQLWYWLLLCAVLCYFIGCFNFAVLISHFKKKDIRGVGSGNPGSMNMTRTFGLKVGIVNFICDACKGGLPALAGFLIFREYVFSGTEVLVSDFIRYFCGAFVIIGHIFPVTLKFKGGKGIASTLGLFLFTMSMEQRWYVFIVIASFVLLFLYMGVAEWGSMASLMGVSGLTVWQSVIFVIRYQSSLLNGWVIATFMILLIINFLTWFAHRKNIYRLLAGEEHCTRIFKHKKYE